MAGSLPPLDHGHLTLMKFSITGRLGAHHKQKLSKFSAEIERLRHVVPDRPAKPAPSRERAAPKLRPLEAPPRMVVKTQNPFPESPKSKSSLSPIHTEAKLKLLMRHDLKAMPTVKPLIRKGANQEANRAGYFKELKKKRSRKGEFEAAKKALSSPKEKSPD
eukprot:CAMPEP_0172599292 /NCGR_PEP_ID=MMETSP1068-20121228/19356_1 /TAXON_ID=35684 /ORGANISM="Pseudopedinella elastica, Strain CCMP716" /LENGTH=161 /DNA_ID=CAMNT_0013399495 /DNA_START=258 /DNA_END=743 /DNA_ORIENTATION=-